MRLGLFVDAAFRRDGEGGVETVYCGDELLGFGSFACAVGERFDGFALIARATEDAAATPYAMPPGVELLPLPHYGSLRRLGAVIAALPATVRGLWRAAGEVDLIWVSASNPIGLILIGLARLRGTPTAILVRQDSMAYFRSRLPSRLWAPLLAPLWLVDRIYRALARRKPTTVVGAQIARRYRAPRPNVLRFSVNLIGREAVAAEPRAGDWQPPVRLLTVGRIEPEKNPMLLAEALAILERREPGRYSATWAGEGRLREPLAERARELGLDGRIELPGFVPFGEPLLRLYGEADAFVHIALTEGVPGVIGEAMASGLPVVATDVGGIRDETGDGNAALLVRPDDAEALAGAVESLDRDPELRGRLAVAGIEHARATSIEAQSERVAAFLAETN